MYRVLKRDKQIIAFDISKITGAIKKAFDAEKVNYEDSTINLLALSVTADFQNKIRNDLIAVEDIQDSVEAVLSRAGYEQVAKAYILYRANRTRAREAGTSLNALTQER